MSKTVLTLFFSLVALVLAAQTGTISGRIVDEQKLPLPGATITLNDGQFTFSDRDGYYAFAKVSEGNHQVDVSYIGFTNQSTTISVAANSIATANFILEAGVELAEVVVVGQVVGQAKALNQQAANATTSISSQLIRWVVFRMPISAMRSSACRGSAFNTTRAKPASGVFVVSLRS